MATFYASKTGEVSAREKEHSALVRELAGECMTLLENDGTLPLAGAGKVAVYGNGVRHTVKGGTGSGDVNTRTVVTIEQGLKEAGFEILTGKWLDEYDKVLADAQAAYQAELAKKAEELHIPIFAVMFSEAFAQPDVPAITEKEDTDTAIYVLSRNSGEGADRYNRACDYLLGENELADIAYLAEHYEKTVLILNIANLVDTTELKKIKGLNAILLAGQAGNATGNIVADVVLGKSIPSGKLTDTWARSYEDYPSSATFSHRDGNLDDEYYSDGIYVGYRYYTTVGKKVRFPFGYGLSYTTFAYSNLSVDKDGVTFTIKNTGDVEGTEIAQLYVGKQSETIFRPVRELKGFARVTLAPGEEKSVHIAFDDKTFRFYDTRTDTWEVESGNYQIMVGTDADTMVLEGSLDVAGTVAEGGYSKEILPEYFSGKIENVDDIEYRELYGREIPDGSWSGEIQMNDAVCQLYYGKGIFGKLFYGVLKLLLKISEWQGKPNLNVLFNYNMPIRGYAKMTGGFVTMEMARALTEMANGHRIKGTAHLIKAAVKRD